MFAKRNTKSEVKQVKKIPKFSDDQKQFLKDKLASILTKAPNRKSPEAIQNLEKKGSHSVSKSQSRAVPKMKDYDSISESEILDAINQPS